jgi:predicted transcriptional regulator
MRTHFTSGQCRGVMATSQGRLRYAVELIMAEPTVRDRILQALEDLPPDATFDDAIERLVFLAKIDAGLAELDAGKGVPHDEAKRRLGL